MTSQVLHSDEEATYITVESASFYGLKEKPSRVLVNSQDALFTYTDNQVRHPGARQQRCRAGGAGARSGPLIRFLRPQV